LINLNLETATAKSRMIPPIKYRKPAKVNGVPQLNPILITTKSDAITDVSRKDNSRNLIELPFRFAGLYDDINDNINYKLLYNYYGVCKVNC